MLRVMARDGGENETLMRLARPRPVSEAVSRRDRTDSIKLSSYFLVAL